MATLQQYDFAMPDNNTKLEPSNGISGGYRGDDQQILRAMMAFSAIAWYNALEILILIFIIFKKYSGLYFWSVLASAVSIIPYSAGAYLKQNKISPHLQMFHVCLSTFGWIVMVPGQSVVLYSRLHLVTQNEKLLKFIIRMIIFNAIILCIPTAVLTFGSNTPRPEPYLPPYAVYEKIQMTVFTIQELFISGVYLVEVRKILKVVMEGGTKKVLWQLVTINLIIILMDIALLGVEFADYYQIETTIKGMIYSIKLKLEFGVLSNLVDVVSDKHERHRIATNRFNKLEIFSEDIESLPSDKLESRKASIQKMGIHTHSKDDNIMYPDWRFESEPSAQPVPSNLADEIKQFKNARHDLRRCSIEKLYPGRLSPHLQKPGDVIHIETISKDDDSAKDSATHEDKPK